MEAHSSKFSDFLSIPFHGLIDTFFPPSCPLCKEHSQKNSFCTNCNNLFRKVVPPFCSTCGIPFETVGGEDHVCGQCIREIPSFDRAASLFHYEDNIRSAIRGLKYSAKTYIAPLLGDIISAHNLADESYDAIVPVPLHITRLRERGFNQSILIASNIGKYSGMEVNPYVLERNRPTLSQAGMKSKERRLNVKGAFSIRGKTQIEGKNYLLIDDVYTTGATVKECATVLKKAGATKVNVLTVARVVL